MQEVRIRSGVRGWLAGFLLAGILPAGPGQEPPAATDLASLRAELRAVRSLYNPDGPIRLRFTLVNCSEQPVTIPLDGPVSTADGVGLPLQLVFGSEPQRFLTISYEGEAFREVPVPAAAAPSAAAADGLRLAAHASLGAEIDLRDYYPAVRYSGSYRVEWRPFDGRLGVQAVDFKVEPRKDAILVTDLGKVTFILDYDRAPRNVENFLSLVREGFYNGKTFHRVVAGFVIQGGCPRGDGTGIRPDGKLVPAEFSDWPVDVGTLLMARKPSDPDSASCQFFIALARLKELDGQYTVIGQASDPESLRTLQELAAVPVDGRDRPLTPLTIRSINLVDAEQSRVREPGSRPAERAGPESGQAQQRH